ncbi:MAG: hypothetical protein J7500_12515 [Sphingomonas sp.]|uniref:hypothetical protein n=1 Tax=Sphingomonas sp. TaxID=28214 RepID=UPI001B21C464|nr:hypothetical protein [Sphingomonas sp.]MBO9623524.1 hypothetical protein [Sphingomonas sp.]
MRLAIIMSLGALALAGCTGNEEFRQTRQARAERDLAAALKGRVPGEPRDCISNFGLSGPQIIDSRTLLYREGRRVWRNDLAADCPGMSPGDMLIVEVHGSQLCRNDRFRAVSPGTRIPGAFCLLGRFTPYERK